MVTLRDRLPPSALRALEQVFEGPAAPPEADPKLIADRAEAITRWARRFVGSGRSDALHVTQQMLDGIPDPELRAEVILAVLVEQAKQEQISIIPRPGSPFMAASMAEALRKLLELSQDDLLGYGPDHGLARFEALVTAALEGLESPNPPGYVTGHLLELSPEKPETYRGKEGTGLRFGSSSPRVDLEPRGTLWIYTDYSSPRSAAKELSIEGLHEETLTALQQRIRGVLGAAIARPSHPGLARFAEAAAGPYAAFQHCLDAVEQALASRAERARSYERMQTQELLALLGAQPGAVGKVDRQGLETALRSG